ncbi:hypothetical protein GCM10010981_18360 [Dyella nitratireducens]|uniref:Uncharacterized protein n=1 Tax=Dyella nitratireducens TaxID=1849580 RepID=A0ABQ1FSW5_9GAMM|nr:hypothetical protein GCM10010981_18360 [Dyella nitratireducens]GLQ43100.1 hypothetical protein GCM10007902_29500 [Dyella nitratireducens]
MRAGWHGGGLGDAGRCYGGAEHQGEGKGAGTDDVLLHLLAPIGCRVIATGPLNTTDEILKSVSPKGHNLKKHAAR